MRQQISATAPFRLLPLAMLATLAVTWGQAQVPETGLVAFSYGTSGNSTPTGEKPESKLWWNDGSWWGSLYHDPSQEHRIFRLDAGSRTWVDTGTALDDRGNAKADVLWDPSAQKLYVASHVFSNVGTPVAASSQWSRLYRYSYLAAGGTYSLDPGFPVAISRSTLEALTIAKDSLGRLWATWVESARVMVSHSLDDDTQWSQPFVLQVDPNAVSVSVDDISAVVAFGSDQIGVMWSNQVAAITYFAVHRDGDPETLWQPEEIVLPDAGCSGPCSDDHISLKADSEGRVLAATKTEQTDPDAPLVLVTMRAPGGGWTSAVFGLVKDEHTRPILLLDQKAKRVYVFATRPEKGGAIYFKDSPLGTLSFAPGAGEPFIELSGYTWVNNASSTKQNLSGATDLVVLASDKEMREYLFNTLGLSILTYCTAGTSASSCQALLSASGTASATAPSGFTLSAATVEGQKDGLFLFGTNGQQANPWGNGTSYHCVVPPVNRAGTLAGSGTLGVCDGSFAQDLNALWCPSCPKPAKNPGPGALVHAQLWYRDPFSTSNQTTSFSDAIQFSVGP